MLDEINTALGQALAAPPPPDADTIVAAPVASAPSYLVGRNHAGETCALIRTSGGSAGPDVRLQNLAVQQRIRCRVAQPAGGNEVLVGSLVACRANDPAMVGLFLRQLADAVGELGPTPSAAAVAGWVQALSALFSRLETAGRKVLRGLWAELLVIHEAADPLQMLRHWHADPRELLDFLGSRLAIEVKSCSDLERIHQFSLAQLRPPPELAIWVASVPTRADPQGVSTLELLERVEGLLPTREARAAARSIVFATAGSVLSEDQLHRFDLAMARAGLRLLDARAVPRIAGEQPADVLEVKLTVRCRDVPPIGTAAEAARLL